MPASTRLTRKLLAGLVLGLGLASLVFLALFMEIYRAQLGKERANASEQVTRLLQVSLENAMLKRDLPGLEEIVRRLGQQPGIASVRIVNPAREVRFASNPGDLGRSLGFHELGCPGCTSPAALQSGTSLVRNGDGAEVLRSVNPIHNKEACAACHGLAAEKPLNGILVVDHEAAGLRTEALRAAAAMTGAGFLVVLIGMGGVWVTLKRNVLEPVMLLDTTSRELAAGKLGIRIPIDEAGDSDELTDLCKSFNAMAARIEGGVEEIREKEAFLQLLIDTVPDGVRVIDETYTVQMVNQAYLRQTAPQPGRALVGERCYAVHGRNEPCPKTLITCPFAAIAADGAPIRYVHRHVRGDGTDLHVETNAARLTLMKDGKPKVLIVEAIRDLDQQVKYSQEQRLAEIGQLAAGVAHEIYNPLASIRIGLQAIKRKAQPGQPLDDDTKSYLAMVDGEVDKCIDVTKRLLDLSQLPSHSVQLVSCTTIVPEVLSLLRYDAEQTGVTVALDLGDQDLRLLSTDSEVRMLVLNLAQNAFHAMPDGGTLSIAGRHEAGNVVLTFRDTGVGIPAENLAHIFEPFFSRRADGVSGTGLGLTICKAIATRYGGRLDVESAAGRGTTFTLIFPQPGRDTAAA